MYDDDLESDMKEDYYFQQDEMAYMNDQTGLTEVLSKNLLHYFYCI